MHNCVIKSSVFKSHILKSRLFKSHVLKPQIQMDLSFTTHLHYTMTTNNKSKVIGVTESSKLLFEDWIITVGVSEIPINEIILHNKLVGEGLAKSQDCSFARAGHLCGTFLCNNTLNFHVFLGSSKGDVDKYGSRNGCKRNPLPCSEASTGLPKYIQLNCMIKASKQIQRRPIR